MNVKSRRIFYIYYELKSFINSFSKHSTKEM
nr:MAG TPA: hypothetical protein [Caudoviricetes sp.]